MFTPPINRLPDGLLDFLGIRSGGRNPQNLTEQLLPTLDLTRWFKDVQQFVDTANLDPLIANTNAGLIPLTNLVNAGLVPQNECWFVLPGTAITWTFAVVAGLRIRGNLVIQRNPGVGSTLLDLPCRQWGYDASDAAIIQSGGMTLTEEMWMPPNSRLTFSVAGALADPVNNIFLQATISIVRLRV